MRRPLVWAAVLWTSGIAAAMADSRSALTAVLAALAFALMAAAKAGRWTTGRGAAVCLAIWLVSVGYHYGVDHRNESALKWAEGAAPKSGDSVEVRGVIATPVQIDGDHVSFQMKAKSWRDISSATHRPLDWRSASGEKLQISLRLLTLAEQERASRWEIGDQAEISGSLLEPSGPRNFGDFDYRTYLYRRHIHWMVSLKGPDSVQVTSDRWSRYTLQRWTERWRKRLADVIDRQYEPISAGLMKGLLIGVLDDLDPAQADQFASVGMTHLLSISGLHVGIFLLCCMGLMRLCGVPRETGLLIAMAIVPFFILITGASPPVLRSGLMALIALQAARLHRLKDGLNIAAAVGLLMLLWNPYYAFNVSFQLSFLVTAGLIVGVPPMSRLLSISWKRGNALVSVTFVAQFVSFPLSVYYFHQFSLLSWLANLLLIPVFELIVIPLGYLALPLSLIYDPAGRWISVPIQWVLGWNSKAIEWLNRVDVVRLIWPQPSIAWVLAYFVSAALLLRSLLWWKALRSRPTMPDPKAGWDAEAADEPDRREERQEGRQEDRQALVRKIWSANGRLSRKGSESDEDHGLARRRASRICALLAGAIGLLLLYGYEPEVWSRSGHVDFIDVGQGDCILIRTPSDATILIDGGGTLRFGKPGEEWAKRRDPYEVGRKLLVPLLKRRGVHHIDYLIATHEDADHIGGLREVLEQIPVDRLIFNGTLKPGKTASDLFQTALDRGVALYTAGFGEKWRVDRATELDFVYPLSAQGDRIVAEEEQNENCLVFLLKMYGSTFLFTGDINSENEARIMESLREDPVYAAYVKPDFVDVLKVAHHGSKTSTSSQWLDYWRPRQAVISVGANNVYGHPTAQVLERLADRDIPTLRTDLDGEIQMQVNRRRIRIRYLLAEQGEGEARKEGA